MLLHMVKPMARVHLMRAIAVASQHRWQSKTSVPPKIQQLQKKFQKKTDVPVHLKGGAFDKILYFTTVGLAGCGVVYMLVFLAGYIID